MFFDILQFLPDDLKTKWRDTLVEKLANIAAAAGRPQAAHTLKHLRSDAAFTAEFERGLERAAQRFVDEYQSRDPEVVTALVNTPTFFHQPEIQQAMLALLNQPGANLETEKAALGLALTDLLPERFDQERVGAAITYLLRCLAQELWHLPELSGIYALQFQRLTAEGIREQLAVQHAQLDLLNRLDGGLREALLQLSDAVAEAKLLPGPESHQRGKTGVLHNLPQPDYGEFVGREAEMAKLFELLRPYPHSRHHLIVIDGIGGIGKSTMALEVAHRCLHASEQAGPSKADAGQSTLTSIRETLTNRFNIDELRSLCFDLALDYDILPGSGKAGKARELVAYMHRRNRVTELIEVIREQRPDANLGSLDQSQTAAETFEAIIWTSAKQSALTADGLIHRRQVLHHLEDIYLAIADTLGRKDITRASLTEQHRLVQKVLSQHKTLLIVDNLETVDDEGVIAFLRELPAPTKAIVTTRHRIDIAYPIRLEGMPWEDARELIRDECEKKGVELSEEETYALFRRTGGVPLALVWAIGQIGQGYSMEAMLTRLAEPVNDIIKFCFDEAMRLIAGQPAYPLLLALALATPDASREFLGFVSNLPTLDRDEGLVSLEKLSLINKAGSRFALLPLTRLLATHELEKDQALLNDFGRRRAEYLKHLGGDISRDYGLRYGHFKTFEEGENLLAAIQWAYDFGSADDVFALMPLAIDYLDGSGRWNQLQEMLERVINLAYSAGRPGLVGRFKDTQGWLLEQTGDYEAAREEFSDALESYSEIGDQKSRAFVLQRLSSVMRKLGQHAQAHAYLEEARAIANKFQDGDLIALVNTAYGKLARDEQNWELSWEYFQKVRRWFEERTVETPRDEELAVGSWGHLAIIAYHLGRPQEAKELCLRSINYFEDLGTKGYLATLKYRLALAEEALGNEAEALKNAEESLYWVERLGMKPDYPKTKKLLDRLKQKDTKKAQ